MKNLGCLICVFAAVGSVQAKLVSQEFHGALLNNLGVSEAFMAEFPAGTAWTMTVEWDDEQEPLFISETQSQWATTRMTLSFESAGGQWESSAVNGTFTLNEYGSIDEIQFTSGWGPDVHTNPELADYPLYSFNVVLTHSMGEAIDGVARVPSQINLDDWMLNISELKIYVNDAAFPVIKGSIDGDVTVTTQAGVATLRYGGKSLKSGKSTLNTGKVVVGGKPKSRWLTMENPGEAPLEGLKVRVLGKMRKDFRVRGFSATTLEPSEKARIKVFFKPKKSGVRKAKLKVLSSDPQSPFVIQLKGRGL